MQGATLPLAAFRELWIHTGTACNLSCPFCHEGSKPGDTRLEALTLAQIAPVLDEAAALGVERFAFTGGEPLILREILPILRHALALRPALVLTNGTAPFIRKPRQLAELSELAHPLVFRVSIDYPDEARHDAGRGLKNFRKALEGLRLLHAAGFAVGITRQRDPDEAATSVNQRFRNLLRKALLPEDLPIVALPELGLPLAASQSALPEPRDAAIAALADAPTCTRSRMVLRREGKLRMAPCPLVDDTPALELGDELGPALQRQATLSHRRCGICLAQGVDYAGD